ncbi:oxygen-dependent coproporphyrinogen oxidase [Candidatus Marinamargulisbacteria bacterium SCGC AG-343-K17]|nr:oxygen-dependent coproporphyrinogen oxidase [Candidatus Marinamargulisbacteria bacterium SCGC AG-343-K17]
MASDQAQQFATLVKTRQNDICDALSAIDDVPFHVDEWTRPGGGGGNTRILTSSTFEKAGVNTSQVFGTISTKEAPMFSTLIDKVNPKFTLTDDSHFFATGVSLVIHPKNPFVPTVHANYRFFECTNNTSTIWWMGGGADLTPYYLDEDDATHFHTTHHQVCEAFIPGCYNDYKKACDDYFFLPHRGETRGIGGIFFDYLSNDYNAQFSFISNISKAFIDAYLPIVKKQKDTPYSDEHREWQAVRRGRYAEFNLLYDRGTLFGLKTNGRIESILMSMPPKAQWTYDHSPLPNSPEYALLNVLKHPQPWVKTHV